MATVDAVAKIVVSLYRLRPASPHPVLLIVLAQVTGQIVSFLSHIHESHLDHRHELFFNNSHY